MFHKAVWRTAGIWAPLLFTASLACMGQGRPVIVPSGESPVVIDTKGNWNGVKSSSRIRLKARMSVLICGVTALSRS
jgi:hypothetical protein